MRNKTQIIFGKRIGGISIALRKTSEVQKLLFASVADACSFESVLRYQINAIFGRTTRESGNRVTLAIFKNSRALGSNLPALLEKSAAAQQRLPRCSPGWIHRPVAGRRAAIPGDAVVANGPAHQI